jgi:hypothetical protein
MKLIKITKSICPEDLRTLDAELWEIDGQVIMRKTCPDHGSFEDVYWSDYGEYIRANKFRDDGTGLPESRESELGCPHDCGVCQEHRTHTGLLIIDVTNRCNLRCPICFARGGENNHLYEPTIEQIRGILEYTQEINHPLRVRAVGNSGGEPTLREDLLEIIKMEKELGFDYVLVLTNGIRIAEDIDYFKKLCDLKVFIYLQFDGVTSEPYIKARGRDLWPIKQKVIENARKIGFDEVVCVPTVAKGINDHQVGEMIRYVAQNSDVIKHIVFQPVSFTGRIDTTKLKEMRITTSDVMRLCEEQTDGEIKSSDFFSLPMNQTLVRLINKGAKRHDFCVHPHCGVITLINHDKNKMVPAPRFVKNEKYYASMRRAFELNKSTPGIMWALVSGFIRYVHPKLWLKVAPILFTKSYTPIRSLTEDWLWRRWFTVSVMHFMDPYNFDLDRLQGCALHYGVPDNETKARLIPFCAMNNIHRPAIEEQFAIHSKEEEPLVPA